MTEQRLLFQDLYSDVSPTFVDLTTFVLYKANVTLGPRGCSASSTAPSAPEKIMTIVRAIQHMSRSFQANQSMLERTTVHQDARYVGNLLYTTRTATHNLRSAFRTLSWEHSGAMEEHATRFVPLFLIQTTNHHPVLRVFWSLRTASNMTTDMFVAVSPLCPLPTNLCAMATYASQ